MNKPIISVALCTLIFSLLSTDSHAVNIVLNPSFEGSTYVDSQTGETLPSDWYLNPPDSVSLSNVYVSNAVNPAIDLGPENGSNYMSFQSKETDGSQDCLYQQLDTVANQEYKITFSVAITAATTGPDAYLKPEWDQGGADDTFLLNSFYYDPTNTGPVAYQTFSFDEEASTDLTTFYFHAIDSYGSILVDNVSVSAVPEPSTWAMLAGGFGTLFLVRRRR